MQDPQYQEQNIALVKNAPDVFLNGETPKLIDEWQIIPFIWNAIRLEKNPISRTYNAYLSTYYAFDTLHTLTTATTA